jgi:hypothetical protein
LFLAISEVRVTGQGPEPGPDLGDAPDSDFTHHPGVTNTAYFPPAFPVPVPGHFPTVWESVPRTAARKRVALLAGRVGQSRRGGRHRP